MPSYPLTAVVPVPLALLVDADAYTAVPMAGRLGQMGYDVSLAADDAEAWGALRGGQFALLVLGGRPPDGSGPAFLAEAADELRRGKTRVVAVASPHSADASALRSGGAVLVSPGGGLPELRAAIEDGLLRSDERIPVVPADSSAYLELRSGSFPMPRAASRSGESTQDLLDGLSPEAMRAVRESGAFDLPLGGEVDGHVHWGRNSARCTVESRIGDDLVVRIGSRRPETGDAVRLDLTIDGAVGALQLEGSVQRLGAVEGGGLLRVCVRNASSGPRLRRLRRDLPDRRQ